jgi:hypothetical protein
VLSVLSGLTLSGRPVVLLKGLCASCLTLDKSMNLHRNHLSEVSTNDPTGERSTWIPLRTGVHATLLFCFGLLNSVMYSDLDGREKEERPNVG